MKSTVLSVVEDFSDVKFRPSPLVFLLEFNKRYCLSACVIIFWFDLTTPIQVKIKFEVSRPCLTIERFPSVEWFFFVSLFTFVAGGPSPYSNMRRLYGREHRPSEVKFPRQHELLENALYAIMESTTVWFSHFFQ